MILKQPDKGQSKSSISPMEALKDTGGFGEKTNDSETKLNVEETSMSGSTQLHSLPNHFLQLSGLIPLLMYISFA